MKSSTFQYKILSNFWKLAKYWKLQYEEKTCKLLKKMCKILILIILKSVWCPTCGFDFQCGNLISKRGVWFQHREIISSVGIWFPTVGVWFLEWWFDFQLGCLNYKVGMWFSWGCMEFYEIIDFPVEILSNFWKVAKYWKLQYQENMCKILKKWAKYWFSCAK